MNGQRVSITLRPASNASRPIKTVALAVFKAVGRVGREDVAERASTKRELGNAAIGLSVAGGTAATAVGVVAAWSSATGAISAIGAGIGGIAGALLGSGVGLATGGVGMGWISWAHCWSHF